MTLPLTTSQQSSDLKGACWNVNQGVGAVSHISPEASKALRTGRARSKAALAESTGYSFTVNNLTPGCGLNIDDGSMTYTPDLTTPGVERSPSMWETRFFAHSVPMFSTLTTTIT